MMPFHSWADDPRIAEHLPPVVAERLELYQREVLDSFPGDRRSATASPIAATYRTCSPARRGS